MTTRIMLGDTTRMVFVNCHLASGNEASYLERRVWDVNQILGRTQFAPIVHAGVQEDEAEKIGDEDFAFWFGDPELPPRGPPGRRYSAPPHAAHQRRVRHRPKFRERASRWGGWYRAQIVREQRRPDGLRLFWHALHKAQLRRDIAIPARSRRLPHVSL